MFQRTSLRGFAVEALQHFLIAGQAFGDRLNRDLAVELPIKGAVDETHPPATENLDHFVLSDTFDGWSGHKPPANSVPSVERTLMPGAKLRHAAWPNHIELFAQEFLGFFPLRSGGVRS